MTTHERRFEVLLTGVGGKGVLLAGELLARAAMSSYRHVVWFPSYASARRGADCECTVIGSDSEIASPIVSQVPVLVVSVPSYLTDYEVRVKPGGLVISESLGLTTDLTRKDIRMVEVPAVATSLELGNAQAANLVLLGSYLHLSGAVPVEAVERELEAAFGGKASVLALNRSAVQRGMQIARALKEKTPV